MTNQLKIWLNSRETNKWRYIFYSKAGRVEHLAHGTIDQGFVTCSQANNISEEIIFSKSKILANLHGYEKEFWKLVNYPKFFLKKEKDSYGD